MFVRTLEVVAIDLEPVEGAQRVRPLLLLKEEAGELARLIVREINPTGIVAESVMFEMMGEQRKSHEQQRDSLSQMLDHLTKVQIDDKGRIAELVGAIVRALTHIEGRNAHMGNSTTLQAIRRILREVVPEEIAPLDSEEDNEPGLTAGSLAP